MADEPNVMQEALQEALQESQKEKDDAAFVQCYKDQMPYIKKMVTTIEGNMKNGKISKKEHNAELQSYWGF